MSIPIIIINFNRLSTTEYLYDQLLMLGYENIFILDMGSTYEPLLDWYTSNPKLQIIYHHNSTHKALWDEGLLQKYFSQYPWVAISDSDIQLNSKTPKGFIEEMICIAKDCRVDKVGLAIQIDDISNEFLKQIIVPIENKYWKHKYRHQRQVFSAAVDTSFCVVRTDIPFTYQAVRVAGNFCCRHTPWYTQFDNLSEEERYFIEHCNPAVSTYAAHYYKWLKE